MSVEPVARVTDLSVTFQRAGRSIHALRGVSLEIRPGEILGLVGESGSGKSVLGMSLLGLLGGRPRTGGEVLVHDENMLTATEPVKRKLRREQLGAVFQDPMTSLNPTMRVGAQVAEAAGSDEEAERLLKAVGIPEAHRRMKAFPHELSGGLRQRVMIAMAVAGSPSLVIADEPTTALDVTVQAQVLTLLRSLRDEIGCSFLLITHDLGVAAQVADRVAVMYAGRLAELGPTDTVLHSAAHPYSLGLMHSRLTLESPRGVRLATLPGEVPDPADPPPGCPFQPRCPIATQECEQTPPPMVEIAEEHASACIHPVQAWQTSGEAEQNADHEIGEPIVTVKRVVKRFKGLQALREVDLTVRRGESVAIVGESGSGKSTLLRVIAGLERADFGEVTRPRGVQMVFQDTGASLTPWLKVGELIGERVGRTGRKEKVREALAQVGLPPEVAGTKPRRLSGGQRQRVALARATVIPPEVLLCDEPTSALDVSLAAGVINLIQGLRQALGMAVVFVTHDLSVARIIADRVAVMYLGRIVEEGPVEEIVGNPRHPYTKALVAAIPDFGVKPNPLSGDPASPHDPPPGCAFHPRCPVALPTCSDAELDPRLIGVGGGADRKVACIHPEVA